MKEIVRKLVEIERKTSQEKGEYDFFALFLRENSSEKWDILVAANWIDSNKEAALKYLAKNFQNSFNSVELLSISRIVLIEDTNPALPALQQAINIEHGAVEIKNSDFFGLQIQHAYLITSKNRQVA